MTHEATPPADERPAKTTKAAEKPVPKAEPKAKAPVPQNSNMRGAPPQIPAGAPTYRVTGKPHLINGRIVYPDQGSESIVRFDGVPGALLEPLDDAAKQARAAADAARAERRKQAEQERAEVARLRKLIGKA